MTDMRMTENLSKWEKIRQRFRLGKKSKSTHPDELFADLSLQRPQTSHDDRPQPESSEPQPSSHPRPPTRRDVHYTGYRLSVHSGSPGRPRSQTVSGIWTVSELDEDELLTPEPSAWLRGSLSRAELAAAGYEYEVPSFPTLTPQLPPHPQLVAAEDVYKDYTSQPIPGYRRERAKSESVIIKFTTDDGFDGGVDDEANNGEEFEEYLSPSSTPFPPFTLPSPLFEPASDFNEVLHAQSRNYRWTQNFSLLQATPWSEEAKEKLQKVGAEEAQQPPKPGLQRRGAIRMQRKRDHGCVEDPSCPCTDDVPPAGFF